MLCKRTNEVISTISCRKSGALVRTPSAAEGKVFSGQEAGKRSRIIRMRTTIFELLCHARHFGKCFMLELNCAPNGQWEHKLTKQQQYSPKESDHRFVFNFCLEGEVDFILLQNKKSYKPMFNNFQSWFHVLYIFHREDVLPSVTLRYFVRILRK